jgi:hypothetical protein
MRKLNVNLALYAQSKSSKEIDFYSFVNELKRELHKFQQNVVYFYDFKINCTIETNPNHFALYRLKLTLCNENLIYQKHLTN